VRAASAADEQAEQTPKGKVSEREEHAADPPKAAP